MMNIVVIHRTAAGGMVRHILQMPSLADIPIQGTGHTGTTAATTTTTTTVVVVDVIVDIAVTTGPTSGGRRLEWGCRTIDNTLAADHLLLVEISRETVCRLHAEGAEIVFCKVEKRRFVVEQIAIERERGEEAEKKDPKS